ncbi:MAG: serine hydrolase domain-containing protein [Lagierella massiliensis]|nr:serine hydrolase domain-containing protein [Lagierella massiliensis]
MKKIISFILSVLMVLSISSQSFAQNKYDRKKLEQKVDKYIEERKEGTASISMGFFEDGEVLFKKQYGLIDVENNVPVSEDSVYEWGSVSKSLIWVSIMQLVEEEKISLDEDVKTYFPEDFKKDLKFEKKVTVLDLMNHQGGFQEVTYPVEFENKEEIPELKELLLLSQPPQIYNPGEVTAYNNWSSALASYVVECVSGVKFYEYVNENIFKRLEMDKTSIKPDWTDNDFVSENRNKSKSYAYFDDSKENLGKSISYIGLYPAGSCAGTLDDFLKFAVEFTKSDSVLFKQRKTLNYFKTPSLYYKDTKVGRNFHGLWSIDYKTQLIGHSGNTQGYTSSFFFNPEDNSGYLVMTNEVGETSYNYGLGELFYGKPEKVNVEDNDITGVYFSKRTIEKGFARFVKYFSGILPISKTKSNTTFKVSIGNATIKSIGNGFYRFDNGNGLSYNLHKIAGIKYFENYTTDYEKFKTQELVIAVILLLSMVTMPITLLVNTIVQVVRKIRRKKNSKYVLINHLTMLLSTFISLTFFYLWMFTDNYNPNKIRIISIILIIFSVIILLNLTYQLYNRLKDKNKKIDLIGGIYLLTSVISVLFFQLYNFWS